MVTGTQSKIEQPRYPKRNLPLTNYCEVDEPDEDEFICKLMSCVCPKLSDLRYKCSGDTIILHKDLDLF